MNETSSERNARRLLAAVIFALMAGGLSYRVLVLKQLQHSSLVFIGIPAVIAFSTLYVRPRSAIGTINKIIAIALCLSGVVFGEALVCIIMSAPIFILAGTVVGALINWVRKPDDPPTAGSTKWRASLGVALLPLSVEGVVTGAILVFTLTIGSFVTVLLLGKNATMVLPVLIYQQLTVASDWPFAAAMGVTLLGLISGLLWLQAALRATLARARP